MRWQALTPEGQLTSHTCDAVQVTFPVAIGEFGSKFEEPEDIQAMQDLASYLGRHPSPLPKHF